MHETHNQTRWLRKPNPGPSHLPQKFWISYEYLIHDKSEDPCAPYIVISCSPDYVDCGV